MYSDDNLDVIENEDGSAEIVEKDEDQDSNSAPEEFYTKNLAELLSPDERDEISIEFIELIEKEGVSAAVIVPPQGKDPDELLNENPSLFKKAIKNDDRTIY